MKKETLIALFVLAACVSCRNNAPQQDALQARADSLAAVDSMRQKEMDEMRQLAEMDRLEMENQYEEFALQYERMKQNVHDEDLAAKLDAEKKKTESLLEELRQTKATSTQEIMRLKKELETVREVLQDYIRQVDQLQQANVTLQGERDEARAEAERTRQENTGLAEKNKEISKKLDKTVAVAAQLNATSISVTPLKKNGKEAKKSKDVKGFNVGFTIARNPSARTGNRAVYVRLMKPNQSVLNASGTLHYENRTIDYSAVRSVEYGGEELRCTVHVPVGEFLTGGTYRAFIFCDGKMIGSGSAVLEK